LTVSAFVSWWSPEDYKSRKDTWGERGLFLWSTKFWRKAILDSWDPQKGKRGAGRGREPVGEKKSGEKDQGREDRVRISTST